MNGINLTKVGGYSTGVFDQGAAEISAFDSASERLFVVNGAAEGIDVLDLSDPANPVFLFTIDIAAVTAGGSPNSVAVKNGIVVVAVENADKTLPGTVEFFDADLGATDAPIQSVTVGALPDMLTFTPDGTKILVANEGEPNSYGQADSVDPEGSVSIIDISSGVASATVTTAAFTDFNDDLATLTAEGVRIFGPGATVAQDLEPEYISVSSDGQTAYVTLQENNALGILDLTTGEFTDIVALGYKDYSQPGNGLDASDKDGIDISPQPVLGMYQPDAIASYEVDGQTYLVTANEGDARDYVGFSEEERVKDLTLDPSNPATGLQGDNDLGRLNVTSTQGDTDGDGDYDQLYSFGGRSFSIWDANGNLIFDSGDDLETLTALADPAHFNADSTSNTADNRSDNKGPEPEGVALGEIDGHTYAFIGQERVGGVVVYDVTNPLAPTYITYINTRDFTEVPGADSGGDLGPEGLIFVSAADSSNGVPLLIVANEISGTTAIFEINNLFTGSSLGENVSTSSLQDQISLGDGNDTLNASVSELQQDDVIDAGNGIDTLILTDGATTDSVILDLTSPLNQLQGIPNTTVSNFESFDFSSFAGSTNFTGTTGNDTLLSGQGNDTFNAGNGNDFLSGGAGNDWIDGEDGDDFLTDFSGNDTLLGGAGNDTIDGWPGVDSLDGGTGNDLLSLDLSDQATALLFDGTVNTHLTLLDGTSAQNFETFNVVGGAGDDTLLGGGNNDTLNGGLGNDSVLGGAGDDMLNDAQFDASDDTISGDAGNDQINGGAGNDVLVGGDNNDFLTDLSGNDTLNGDAGDDTIESSTGIDVLDGGDGNDLLILNLYDKVGGILFDGSASTHLALADGTTASNFEVFSVVGGSGDDTLIGGADNDFLDGAAGQDVLSGGAGNDLINGEDGDDFLTDFSGNDTLLGGAGNDTIDGWPGVDSLDGGSGNDLLSLDLSDQATALLFDGTVNTHLTLLDGTSAQNFE
ncbi:choice-of-anchor I family protein, partial [Neosynechococcus sphagnicola]|uniref:choice-of-anchor I family protein n=1 Tax=Neosynechococcus sphagnicola TaxID=1501145 RepID=UPI0018726D49